MVGDFPGDLAPPRDQDGTFDRLLNRLTEAAGYGSGPGVVVVDVREFEELSPASARLLERYARSLRRTGNHLVVCGVRARLLRDLHDAGFDRIVGAANIIEAVDAPGGDVEAAYARASTLLRGSDRPAAGGLDRPVAGGWDRPAAGESNPPPGGAPAPGGMPDQGSATN